jgi:hypothetical protein
MYFVNSFFVHYRILIETLWCLIQDTNTGYKIQDTNTGYRIQNTGYRIQETNTEREFATDY